jgi:hypothetical protein
MRARADVELVREQLAHRAHAPVAEMVDVVRDRRLGAAVGDELAAGPQQQQVLDDDDEVLAAQRRVVEVRDAEPELLRTSRPGSRYSWGSFWFSL